MSSPDSSTHASSTSAGFRTLETIAILGAAVLITMPAWRGIARHWRLRHPRAATDAMIDESLKNTYPASDPPTTRFFEIPANRR